MVIEEVELEEVEEYVYLLQLITRDGNMKKVINRQIILGWASNYTNKEIQETNLPFCIKRKIIYQIILQWQTYGSET